MTVKKIIPCLDFKNNQVVKGEQFTNLKAVGDPLELAKRYDKEGADELVLLDISASATNEGRETFFSYVKRITKAITIPLTVGGGIKSIEDIERALDNGASKVSLNSGALKKPVLIDEAVAKFGSDKIVVAIDAIQQENSWLVVTNGGTKTTNLDVISWAKEVEKRGAGSLLVTSKDFDGQKSGYDLKLISALKEKITIPLIASGGAGSLEDLKDGVKAGADAVLAASIFHYSEVSLKECKEYLAQCGFLVSPIKGLEPKFAENGLVVAIAVDYRDGTVLMQAYMNKEAWQETLKTGNATYFSRSRNKLWVKGEESGNTQKVKEIRLDCDRDSVLLFVEQNGVACHTNNRSCFFTPVFGEGTPQIGTTLTALKNTIKFRQKNPQEGSYTNYLFDKGLDKILKKVGEESAEVIIAAKNRSKEEVIYETADLLYHLSVLLEEQGLEWDDIAEELVSRFK